MKKMNTDNFPWYWIIAIALAFLFSCSSSKKISNTSDNKYIDSIISAKVDSVRLVTEEMLNDSYESIEFFNNTSKEQQQTIDKLQLMLYQKGLLTDSVFNLLNTLRNAPCESSIKKDSSGISYTGVKGYKYKKTESVKKSDSVSVDKVKDKVVLSGETKSTEKSDKKQTWFPWWLLVVAYALGVFLPPMKIFDLLTKK
jgi:hypothetical protein